MLYAKSRRVALVLLIAAFLAFSVPLYLTGGTRVPATFAGHYALLVGHVMLGSVAMIAGVVQLLGLRGLRPALHRRVGRCYVAATLPAGIVAVVIGAATPFGPLLAASNMLLASLWLWFTVDGVRAARRGRFTRHRRQMLRSVVLALSVITNRLWTPVLYIALYPLQDSVFGGNEQHFTWFVAGLGGWLGWALPLVLLERWLRRRGQVPPAIHEAPTRHPG